MFPNLPQGITLAKIIGGISRSLTIANQVIPIYQQLNPMVKNARRAFGALKEITASSSVNNKVNNTVNNKKRTINSGTNSSNPSFFQ